MTERTKTLSTEQLMRYSRHIMLPKMDIDGQEALWNSRVLIIGVGGLGCSVSQYLASSGLGQMTLVDDDVVERTNLQRQVLHTEANLGLNKCVSAKQSLQAINSEIDIQIVEQRMDEHTLNACVSEYDAVLDCCDNLDTRNLLNRVCHTRKVPLISGAAIRMEGQVASFLMNDDEPCYQCLSSTFGEQNLTCSEAGILSPVVGIVGCIQATEVIKLLTGVGELNPGSLLMLDATNMDFRRFNIPINSQCPVCSK